VVSNGCTFTQSGNGPLVIPQGSSTIPVRGPYQVRDGDNLFRIALRYGTTVDRLVALNNISNRNLIFPGTVLKVG
jgi:LysM repeat protein